MQSLLRTRENKTPRPECSETKTTSKPYNQQAMSPTQKALYLNKKFGDLVLEDAPIYKPGPGEILIKVRATSLNPIDWKIQKYGVFIEKFPAVLGTDVAGDVEELGEGVNEFKKGDRVYASLILLSSIVLTFSPLPVSFMDSL